MRKYLLILFATLSVLLYSTTFAADWPAFRGPHASGISPETGINKAWKQNPPKMLWKINMRDDGFAGPCVANGMLIIIDHRGNDDSVRAVNLSNGKGVWQFKYSEPGGSNYGFSRSTPAVKAGKVYIASRFGKIFCLSLSNGKKLWARDLASYSAGKPGWDYAWSPLVDGNKVIVQPGGPNAGVVALDASTGKILWQGGGNDKSGYATPVKATINGKAQYVVFTASNLIGVDANNGRILWGGAWKTNYDVNAATPIVIGNSVFITSGYGVGCARVGISKSGRANFIWKNKEMQSHFNTPVASKGYIYGTTDPGDLVCIDAATGRTRWRQSGFEKGGVCGVDGTIIAINGADGDVVMVSMSPSKYQELGRMKPLGGQSWTAPIVADGKLIIRNKTTLACFLLK